MRPRLKKQIPAVSSWDVMRIYAAHVRPHAWLFAAFIIGTLGFQGAAIAIPLFLRQFTNVLATQHPGAAAAGQLSYIILLLGAVYVLRWVFGRVMALSNVHLTARAARGLSMTAFDYLIGHSYDFFGSQFSGTLTRRVTKFVDAFEVLFDVIFDSFLQAAVYVIGAVYIVFTRNHLLGVIFAVWSVAFILLQFALARLRQPLRVHRSEQDSAKVGALADAISNQNAIALFAAGRAEHDRFAGYVQRWFDATMRSWLADVFVWGVQGFFMIIINVAMLYGMMHYWMRGEVTVGDFVLVQTYLLGVFEMLIGISRQFRMLYDSSANAGEMVAILKTPHGITDAPGAPALSVTQRTVSFSHVKFGFTERVPVLSDLDLTIEGGETVALVGASGAGKSTVSKLLLRLYDVTEGSISIDGQDIRNVTQDSLREAIAFVPQEPVLFHRSLMENIRYGKQDATDEEVMEAARKAHCHEFIARLPEGYETFVGERGIKLSGGERQRVAIARAILKDAPILILDEATASLDSESEALIQDALATLMKDKTVIIIAHRLSTIMSADRIVVLEGGKVAADGTHAELLAQGGLYQKLWSIQAGGFIPDEEE